MGPGGGGGALQVGPEGGGGGARGGGGGGGARGGGGGLAGGGPPCSGGALQVGRSPSKLQPPADLGFCGIARAEEEAAAAVHPSASSEAGGVAALGANVNSSYKLIISLHNYVDLYYSVDTFRAAYAQLIPAMPDKTQWPKSDHGFFMHPPLLKATAGRPKTERFKGCGEKKRKAGKHMCPICKDYGHHWHNCKKGNPDDIAAMMAVREPPKRKKKTTSTTESSIVPCNDGAPARMCFPPSLSLETTTKKKGKNVKSSAGASKRKNLEDTSSNKGEKANCESGGSKRAKQKKKEDVTKLPMVPFDSPAMGTRSKKFNPSSPAMSTRSKRRLSL